VASAYDVESHGRLPNLRIAAGRAPFHQRHFAQYRSGAAIPRVATNDWYGPVQRECNASPARTSHLGLEKRICRGDVCDSSDARRIGRMDCRAQGRAQWRFLHANPRRVRALHAHAEPVALRDDVDLSRVRINVEGDFCDGAAGAVVIGLLAAEQKSEVRSQKSEIRNSDLVAAIRRKNPVIRAFGRRVGRDRVRANSHDGFAGAVAAFAATQKCGCQLNRLPAANVLADGPGRFLSASTRSIKYLDRVGLWRFDCGHYLACDIR